MSDIPTRKQVLLTVSGVIPADLDAATQHGRRPRADYAEMAAAMDADIIGYGEAQHAPGPVSAIVRRLVGDDVLLALACWRRRHAYRVVFTDSERVGMMFAALSRLGPRRCRHVMIGHRLSAPKKLMIHRMLGLRRRVDHVVVYASPQRDVAVHRLGYRDDQVTLTPFMVDCEFWRDATVDTSAPPRRMICAVGQELRDYPTLVDAVRDVDVDLVIAAASPWSKRQDTAAGLDIPPNVSVTKFDQYELRDLYAASSFVVVPVEETDFQAGITTILEAMAMRRAVICTRTEGQTDTLIDDVTGIYVSPRDVGAMRAAIRRLLADPGAAERIGERGEQWVREHADVRVYARRLAAISATVGATP